MAKIRVHELAKELNLETKDLLSRLNALGSEAKNHMSTVEEQYCKALRESISGKKSSKNKNDDTSFIPRVKRIRKTDLEASEMEAFNLDAKKKTEITEGNKGTEENMVTKIEADVLVNPEKAVAQTEEKKTEKIVEKEAAIPSEEKKAVVIEKKEEPVVQSAPEKEMPKIEASVAEKAPVLSVSGDLKTTPETPVNNTQKEEAPQTIVPVTPPQQAVKTTNDTMLEETIEKKATSQNTPAPNRDFHQQQRNQNTNYQQDNRDNRGPRPNYQGQDNRGPRPNYQGQDNRGPRPNYQGQDNRGPRPNYQGQDNRGPRPNYQGQDNRGPRPNYQGQDNRGPRPNYQGQDNRGSRPSYQGQDNRGPRPAGGFQGNPSQGNRGPRPAGGFAGNSGQNRGPKTTGNIEGGMKYTTPAVEKPTSRRPDKKLFKDNRDVLNDSFGEDGMGKKSGKVPHRNDRGRKNKNVAPKKQMPPVVPKKVVIGETVVLQDLAKSMGKTAAEVIKKLFEMGVMATINQELESDTAILLAEEFGITVEVAADKAIEIMEDADDDEDDLMERPPVVTVMGHVDHGKTSLLDAIRKTNVIATEAGGITQHIGAYQVEINNKKITFLDTPGHEAFTSMRARGAQVTDVAVLVVAADDGVMPQTVEAINHAKAANVPIIVAINKIDKQGANPDKVKQELMEYGLVAEEWGGDTIMVPVAAKTGQNIAQILEMILLVAEVAELKANPKRKARGTIIESQLDKGRGPLATLLVQKGTLKVGDNILAGSVFGKVRAMLDDKGRKVKAAGPSMPVEVIGFSEVPPPGEIFIVAKDERDAKSVAAKLQSKKREEELRKNSKITLEDLFTHIAEGEIKELNLIVKADVQGSVEAVKQSLTNLNNNEVKVNIIHSGVGAITESDVMLATASTAIIIGFNVRPSIPASKLAETEQVDIRTYRVIYDAIEDVKKAMSGLLDPEFKEVVIGHAEVRQVIKVPKAGMVAGSYITDGKITRQAQVRLTRNGIVVTEDKIDSLKRFKDDVKEVMEGFECGISFENFNDFHEGDVIEAFVMEEIKRAL